jgi:hypothetical protein
MKSTINRLVKAALIAGLGLAVTATAGDQEKKIGKKDLPAPVLSAFEKAYPKAKITEMAREEENGVTYYEIESKDGKIKRDLLYTVEGVLTAAEEKIDPKDLPEAVSQAIKSGYPKAKVEKAEKINRGDTLEYEVIVEEGKTETELVFDPSGKLLKTEKKEEGKKGEKD